MCNMRFAAKVDKNQSDIVKACRGIGAIVHSLAAVGKGMPDLLVGYRGKNFLFEIKDGEAEPGKQKLTPDQVKWHSAWKGRVYVVKSVNEAIEILIGGIE